MLTLDQAKELQDDENIAVVSKSIPLDFYSNILGQSDAPWSNVPIGKDPSTPLR